MEHIFSRCGIRLPSGESKEEKKLKWQFDRSKFWHEEALETLTHGDQEHDWEKYR